MIRLRTNDGILWTGRNTAAIVRQMRDDQWNAPEQKTEWMDEAAGRVHQMTGFLPRSDKAEHFIADLIQCGVAYYEVSHD